MSTIRARRRASWAGGLLVGLVIAGIAVVAVHSEDVARHSVSAPVHATAGPSTASSGFGFAFPADVYSNRPADTDATFDLAAETHLRSVRLPVFWGLVQPRDAVSYDWTTVDRLVTDASERGLRILASLSSTPGWAATPGARGPYAKPAEHAAFGRFAAVLAQRYRGKIGAYEIWNEPNGAAFYDPAPDAISYTGLLRAGYAAIKNGDPAATVVGGALGAAVNTATTADPVEFMRQMYAAGAAGSFDAFSFHPYQYTDSFSAGWTTPNSPGRQLAALRELMIANGDGNKKMWATEFGVPTTSVSESRQSAMIGDFAQKWGELPFTGPIFYFTDRDRMTGNGVVEDNFGLLRTDRTAKDAMWTVFADAYLGVPVTDEFSRFQRQRADPSWGQILSPVVPVGKSGTRARFYQNVGLFETPTGFIRSPAPVADRLAVLGVFPVTSFHDGYQDVSNGGRAYYSGATGTHLVGGGVAAEWTPAYGLAITDEVPQRDGAVKVTFEHGFIVWDVQTGGVATRTS